MNASLRTSNLAIVSLVSGILGWTLLPWIASIVAIVTGHLARAEIKRSAGAIDGDGLALSGLILGYAMIAISFIGLMLILLFFGGLAVLLGWLGFNGHLG